MAYRTFELFLLEQPQSLPPEIGSKSGPPMGAMGKTPPPPMEPPAGKGMDMGGPPSGADMPLGGPEEGGGADANKNQITHKDFLSDMDPNAVYVKLKNKAWNALSKVAFK